MVGGRIYDMGVMWGYNGEPNGKLNERFDYIGFLQSFMGSKTCAQRFRASLIPGVAWIQLTMDFCY